MGSMQSFAFWFSVFVLAAGVIYACYIFCWITGSIGFTLMTYASRKGINAEDLRFTRAATFTSKGFRRYLKSVFCFCAAMTLLLVVAPKEYDEHKYLIYVGLATGFLADLAYATVWGLTPAHVALFGSSHGSTFDLLRLINWQFGHLKVCHLLDDGARLNVSASSERHLYFNSRQILSNMRLPVGEGAWEDVVLYLCKSCPLVILDMRDATELVKYEHMLVTTHVPPLHCIMIRDALPNMFVDELSSKLSTIHANGKRRFLS